MSESGISIIIPTYGRNDPLWDTIRALGPQLRSGDEILVVDQNRPPLRPPADMSGLPMRLLRQEKPSLTRARNLGIERAARELVLFLDDDIVPDGNLLANLRRLAVDRPGRILTGMVEQADMPPDVPTPGSVDLASGLIRTHFGRPVTGEIPFFPGGLALIPKACLPPRPWFCPAFRGAAQGEEIDFALRVRGRGTRIEADPSVRIFHLKAPEGGCRAPDFRRRFFLDHVHNQALFHGRHGRRGFGALPAFLRRMHGFVEYHTRRPGGSGHDPLLAAAAAGVLVRGWLTGFLYRLRG